MEKTNVEKITDEMLVGLSGDSSGSESFDVMLRVRTKMSKIGHRGQVMLFSENPLLSKGGLKR
jgi:hypothetical protein